MKPIIQTSNASNTAHKKISVAKITPTIIFTARDSIDTPPEITEYARAIATFIRNSNDITAHIPTANAFLNHIPAMMTEHPRPLWVFNDWTRRRYTVANNVNSADKPAFRHDSTYLFDILSEDYSA